MPLDLAGNVSLSLSVVSLFLLVLGLPLVKSLKSPENYRRHGYLTVGALTLETILILAFMIPSFVNSFTEILSSTSTNAFEVWLHVVLGVVAEASGLLYIAFWLHFSPSKLRCIRFRKYMMPTFIVWIVAVASGALVHLLQII